MKQPWKGHERGAEVVENLMDWAKELGIKELTLFSFSVDNFKRPKEEVENLLNLIQQKFEKFYNNERLNEEGVKIRFIGDRTKFPEKIQEIMHKLEEKTKNNTRYFVNFAMAYGGRTEIIDATKKIAQQVKEGKLSIGDIDEKTFAKNLYLNSDPDLIIRTGGEKRLSGFLLWQGEYAEFFFSDKLWPEFTKEDLIKIIKEFQRRERRFGK